MKKLGHDDGMDLKKGMSEAIRGNDVFRVNDLLERGFDVHHVNGSGATLLHFACSNKGTKEVCQLLIDRGVDIEARNDRKQTALTQTIERGEHGAFNVLVDAGANVHAPGEADWNPLHFAIVSNKPTAPQFIHELVKRGASIRDFESTESTDPLQLAIQINNLDTAKALLVNGYEEHLGIDAMKDAVKFSIARFSNDPDNPMVTFLNSWLASREAKIAIDGILEIRTHNHIG